MIKLDRKDYGKALEPLARLKINTLFAQAVLHQVVDGEVYVDCAQEPEAFFISHPYRMSLLFGKAGGPKFHGELADHLTNRNGLRDKPYWLQADPEGGWTEQVDSILASHNAGLNHDVPDREILRNSRVNFRFNPEAYKKAKELHLRHDHQAVRTTCEMFSAQPGTVVPCFFWRNEAQFLAEGAGYSAFCEGNIAATSFSAFNIGRQLEIGIETTESFRGKGYAFTVCSALIDYCLERQLEPVWSCRLENEGSYRLAQKLGFEPTLTFPYYRLPV